MQAALAETSAAKQFAEKIKSMTSVAKAPMRDGYLWRG
jgi:hypothetical protein